MKCSRITLLATSVSLALACEIDADSMGTPPMLGTTTGTDDTTDDTAGDAMPDSTGEPSITGPRKRRIDLDPAVAADSSGTTLLVVLDASRIEYDDTQPGGADLRFFGPEEGAAYPVEIERWDPSGRSFVWVRVNAPMLPEYLWMYYGDAQGFGAVDPSQVWDGAFAAVWHMGRDEASEVPDITGNGHTLSPFNFSGNLEADGHIGLGTQISAVEMPTEGGPLDLDAADQLPLTDAFTIEAWIAPDVAADNATHSILRKGDAYALRTLDPTSTRPTLVLRTAEVPGQHTAEAGASLTVGQWSYVVATYQANTGQLSIYRDGVLEGTGQIDGETMQRQVQTSDAIAQVGHNMQGRLDEVRVSNLARSPEWVRLQYASMADELMTFGPPVAR